MLVSSAMQAALLYWFGLDANTALIDGIITNVTLAFTGWLLSNNLHYYRPEQARYLYLAVWCFLLAVFWLAFTQWFVPVVLQAEAGYRSFFVKSLPVRFSIAFLVLGWVAMLSVLWYNQQEQKESLKRQADAEKLAREAELFKLRQQLQPHFLFNSLNSISALIGSRPQEARKMVHQLSDFLRSTLKKEDHQWVSFSEELQHLELYLEIEKVRFGHRLATVIQQEEACGELMLPPMLLQPIVENAIKFGLYDTTEGVIISLQAKREANYLKIQVSNPFDAQTAQPKRGTGFGLAGIQRRLFLLFARTDLLSTATDNSLFITTIKIPQI
ncbi:sensor histidine kinase [Adhaeribacter aquaticus]|uniref:sensor histidine kinase n=1 Tax=Adhaeribacter aquaticus TaxID=299567 RepID=UPI001B7FEEE1|nr:histidine kinase [Adhaeribacter aquaticus]